MQQYLRHRWFLILLIALALSAVMPGRPALAQGVAAIQVTENEATSEFPARITFTLTAESAATEIVGVQLLYGATRQERLIVVDLDVTPGRRVTVRHDLDTEVYYYPPGTEITYRWVIRDANGAEATTPPAEVIHHDARFLWSERTARNVTVYWYRGGEAFGEALLGAATRALDRLEETVGAGLQQPVRIYIYANGADMRSALQANSEEWIGGQAHPELGVIIGAIAPTNTDEIGRLIPHELSHQVLSQLTDNPYGGVPLWFDEGLAMYVQEKRDLDFDARLEEAALQGRLIPLEALAASFPADPDQALLSYAQSRSVVEYLIDTYGADTLRKLALAFAEAQPVDQALRQVLGRGVDELDAEWRATLPPQQETPRTTPAPQVAPPDRFDEPPASQPRVDQPVIDAASNRTVLLVLIFLLGFGALTFFGALIGILWLVRSSRRRE